MMRKAQTKNVGDDEQHLIFGHLYACATKEALSLGAITAAAAPHNDQRHLVEAHGGAVQPRREHRSAGGSDSGGGRRSVYCSTHPAALHIALHFSDNGKHQVITASQHKNKERCVSSQQQCQDLSDTRARSMSTTVVPVTRATRER